MNNFLIKFLLIGSVILIGASTIAYGQKHKLENAEWIIGTWEHQTNTKVVYESWKKINDTSYAGKSYYLKQNDTIFIESIQLIKQGGNFYYIPTVPNQNQGKPVSFKAKKILKEKLEFVNPLHDFPQTIIYKLVNIDSLVAYTIGNRDGAELKITFPMRRIK